MKLRNILLTGMAVLSLTACNNYLDVDAPSAYTEDFVFTQKSEIERALNGVYAQALVNDLYGNAYQRTFNLNSDVDIQISSSSSHSHTSYTRFDCDEQGGDINKFWNAAYALIETADKFIYSAEHSNLYNTSDLELMQWIGEAKCLRAMAYHDLVVMFGDVPFKMDPASQLGDNYNVPVADRQVIQDSIMHDLMAAEAYMSSTDAVTVERCSKEFAQAMIARIALAAGGYSLRPVKDNATSYGKMERPENYKEYYKIAMDYSKKVWDAGTHKLNNTFDQVFIKECNYEVVNNDDPIFELPFAKESTGNTGYTQGPTYSDYEGKTVSAWGKCDGGARLNAFYRYHFKKEDLRREFVNGLWYYSYVNTDAGMKDSVYIRNDYSVHDNKWSKLWTDESNALGNDKSGSTGINFPYMRFADVLLMYAEAANEYQGGPTPEAKEAVRLVRNRAFAEANRANLVDNYINAATTKEAFLKLVLDERKFEFAGENMRWRDLVRNNMYAEELVYCFLRYYSAGMQNLGSMTGYEDAINEHDGVVYIDKLPSNVYFHAYNVDEPIKATGLRMYGAQFYGCTVGGTGVNLYLDRTYPNKKFQSLRIYNAYETKAKPAKSLITNQGLLAEDWNTVTFYEWGNESTGTPKDQCKYSFYGFMRSDANGNIWLVRDGALVGFDDSMLTDVESLPVVRYILPYPNAAIQRSNGAYKNYYGY
ncbi:MAG: RagB/SusD family nutrient uptake outer membrane protein [Prevotella sp.]|nr:RagB/SusD family nutrient uptake outer membrane protein [Candidatus Prevotella equi]